jgi:hypothetical protein
MLEAVIQSKMSMELLSNAMHNALTITLANV